MTARLQSSTQAVDVGIVTYVLEEAIRILLRILGFMSFGYGIEESEATTEHLVATDLRSILNKPQDHAGNENAHLYDKPLWKASR